MSALSRLRYFLSGKRLRMIALLLLLALSAFVLYLDVSIRGQFEGKRWALPARVYARPLELYAGMKLSAVQLQAELDRLGYHRSDDTKFPAIGIEDPGNYQRREEIVSLITRPFVFQDGVQGALALRMQFEGDRLKALQNLDTGAPIALARLDPLLIGSIYPAHNEDRVLVKLGEVPPSLINALIAVEDRKFYSHYGIDPRGIARAVVALFRGGGVQGGSTLTQQLVKNFFLTSERTLRRKFTEMIMAVLLEMHYSKDEILETYINEIYMGQDGSRAIHGFGLASQFYFDKPLAQLEVEQAALLVGLLKGPNYYEPRRNPQNAKSRRDVVLSIMREQDFIGQAQSEIARDAPLGVTPEATSGASAYPAFLDLVHRQLRRDYQEQDLRTEGLRIFTTIDPRAQSSAELALGSRLPQLEKHKGLAAGTLQGAVVITSAQDGEVQALLGGRTPRFEGFNRALDAERPIGSLAKPAIYLTALAMPGSYTLITPLDDSPLLLKQRGTPDWRPENYDKTFHGPTPLHEALAHSYNVAAARLGLAVGVEQVVKTMRELGVERPLAVHASSLLGANELRPIEVVQIYQTLANGGFRVPLRAIREVLTADGVTLQRYPLAVEQAANPGAVYLLVNALQGVVREGTARGLRHYLSPDLHIAGKTGTTNDLRDSWFAGFTGDRVAVVWVGRDDNKPAKLTGASGAMTVWGAMLAKLDPEPLVPPRPDSVELAWIDATTGLRTARDCPEAIEAPFLVGSGPTETTPCAQSSTKKLKGWFKRLFGDN